MAHALRATSLVGTRSPPNLQAVAQSDHHESPAPPLPLKQQQQQPQSLWSRGGWRARSVAVGGPLRSYATSSTSNGDHRAIQVPDFSSYRRGSTAEAARASDRDSARAFTYLVAGGLLASSATFGKWFGTSLARMWSPGRDVLALAKVEVNLRDIPAGKNVVIKWRGKPVFVKHRTPEEIARERAVDVASLRDPQADEERVRGDARWFVAIGVCTHLGCVPIAGEGKYGGYYCPCHGSHYDGAGRIREGPAPLNLEVPEYSFLGDDLLVIG